MKIKFSFIAYFRSNMCSFNHKKLTLNFKIFISLRTFWLKIYSIKFSLFYQLISPFFSFLQHIFQNFFVQQLSLMSINLENIKITNLFHLIFSSYHIYLLINLDLQDMKIYIEMLMGPMNDEL